MILSLRGHLESQLAQLAAYKMRRLGIKGRGRHKKLRFSKVSGSKWLHAVSLSATDGVWLARLLSQIGTKYITRPTM